jgi:hypothetical protein
VSGFQGLTVVNEFLQRIDRFLDLFERLVEKIEDMEIEVDAED